MAVSAVDGCIAPLQAVEEHGSIRHSFDGAAWQHAFELRRWQDATEAEESGPPQISRRPIRHEMIRFHGIVKFYQS